MDVEHGMELHGIGFDTIKGASCVLLKVKTKGADSDHWPKLTA